MGISSIIGWSLCVYVLTHVQEEITLRSCLFFLDLSDFLRYNGLVTFKGVRRTLEILFVRML